MAEPPSVVLYKYAPAWGLPSLSVACVQVEAYLRLAKVQFAVQECAATSASPTGQVPALDTAVDLVGADTAAAGPLAEFAAARTMIDYLKDKVANLDRGLSAAQKAEAAAFAALVEAKLQPAIAYTTWCEAAAYSQHTRGAYGAGMPFPLSYFVPRGQRRATQQHFSGTTSSQVYAGAVEALDALSQRLAAAPGGSGSSGGGNFFFGAQPSSLDALIYACLAYLRAAPVVHPQLQQALTARRPLGAYLDRLAQLAFAAAVPAASGAGLDWSAWGAGAGGDDKYSKARSEKEVELQRKGRRWLLCAAAAIAAYVVLSGQYVQFDLLPGLEYEEEEEEEE